MHNARRILANTQRSGVVSLDSVGPRFGQKHTSHARASAVAAFCLLWSSAGGIRHNRAEFLQNAKRARIFVKICK